MYKDKAKLKETIEKLSFQHIKKGFLLLNSVSDQHRMRALWLKELQKLDLVITFKRNSKVVGLGGYNYDKDKPTLKFFMDYFVDQAEQQQLQFTEYKFLRNREDIGSCAGDLNTVIAALIAHECAHVFQFWVIKMRNQLKLDPSALLFGFNLKDTREGHGLLWQHIYSILRVSWVNKLPTWKYLPPNEHRY